MIIKIPNLISNEECKIISKNYFDMIEKNEIYFDQRCPESPAFYNPYIAPYIRDRIHTRIENVLQKNLHFTFSYGRIYKKGHTLPKHKDRRACEYAISITLDRSEESDWPIFFENEEYNPHVGDGLLYKGHETYHWRNPLSYEWQTGLFIFYVDKDGKFAHLKDDNSNHEKINLPIYE